MIGISYENVKFYRKKMILRETTETQAVVSETLYANA